MDCDSPPFPPIVLLDNSLTAVNMLACLPRGEDHTLEMASLQALFSHLSKEKLGEILTICESYRERAYLPVQELDEADNETDQQNAPDAEHR